MQTNGANAFPLHEIGVSGSLGAQLQNSYIAIADVTIPMKSGDWKKLTRDTQIRLLDELGILNK